MVEGRNEGAGGSEAPRSGITIHVSRNLAILISVSLVLLVAACVCCQCQPLIGVLLGR